MNQVTNGSREGGNQIQEGDELLKIEQNEEKPENPMDPMGSNMVAILLNQTLLVVFCQIIPKKKKMNINEQNAKKGQKRRKRWCYNICFIPCAGWWTAEMR